MATGRREGTFYKRGGRAKSQVPRKRGRRKMRHVTLPESHHQQEQNPPGRAEGEGRGGIGCQ